MNKPTYLCSFLILLAGCATFQPPATTIRYQQMLDTWNGKDINKLIYAWGPPTSTFNMPDGNKMYTWANIKIGPTVTTGSIYRNYGLLGGLNTQSVSTTPTWDCYTTAVTNSSGTIQSWSLKGNNCIFGYSTEEVQQRLEALKGLCAGLKSGTHLRLTFYEGVAGLDKNLQAEHLDLYLVTYNDKFEFIAASKEWPMVGSADDQPEYYLKYIKDITVLK